MAEKNEQLKAQFVLDTGSLAKSIDMAGKKLVDGMKRAVAPLSKDITNVMAAPGPWQKAGAVAGGHMAGAMTRTMGRAIAGIGKSVASASAGMAQGVARAIGKIVTAPIRMITSPLGMIAGGVGAAGVVAGIGKIINAGRDLQDQQVEIQKTTDLTDQAMAELTARLIAFSNATGVSRAALMGLAADAGRLGVKSVDDLERFATTFAKAASATNVGADMAEEVLRVMNTIGERVGNIDRLMSAVNELGNNMATNERRILEFMGVMPGLSTILGLNTSQLLGFAAAASTTANEAGLTGTALNRIAIGIIESVEKGGKQLDIFAKTANVTTQAWKELVARDKNEALLRFIEGVKRTRDEGGNLVQIFSDMGADGARLVRVLLSLSRVTDTLRNGQAMAASEMQHNMSLTTEFGRRLNTVSQQQMRVTEVLKNFFAALNDNRLNTEIFRTLAVTLSKIIDNNQVALAGKFTGLMERIARIVIGLPFDMQKFAAILRGLAEPAYLQGLLGNVFTWLGATLMQTLVTAITAVVEIARIALANIFDPLFARASKHIAVLQFAVGNVKQGLAALTTGMKVSDIVKILEQIGDSDSLAKIKEAASRRGGFATYMTLGGAANATLPLEWVLNEIVRKSKNLKKFRSAAERYGEREDVQERRKAEMNARISDITSDAMRNLGQSALDLAQQFGKLAGVTNVAGTKTQAELDAIGARKDAAIGAFDSAREEERKARQAELQRYAEDVVRRAIMPTRTTLEAPIKKMAEQRGIDFDALSEDEKRRLINRYYQRNPIEGVLDKPGGSGALAATLSREQAAYADMRAGMMQQFMNAESARPGTGRDAVQVSLAPESQTVTLQIDDNGRISGTVKFVESMRRASTANALAGG